MKSKLALRRVKNRKKPRKNWHTIRLNPPVGILTAPKSISDEKITSLKKAWQELHQGLRVYIPDHDILANSFPSNLPGFHWVRKPNPNDGTGFSWYEERIE